MLKFSRNLFHTKWFAKKNIPLKESIQYAVSIRQTSTHPSFEKKKTSNRGHEEEEDFSRQNERFWNFSNFCYLFDHSSFCETTRHLCIVSILCLHFNFTRNNERKYNHCLFPRSAHAMPNENSKKQDIHPVNSVPKIDFLPTSERKENFSCPEGTKFLTEMKEKSLIYAAALENSMGLTYSESNSKKAFRCFQRAARLGSSQGFYNLGLCYELGKGTRVNLERAAFCYRKAALKGHGMASFNLAVYFLHGMGSLPEDPQTAHLLLEQAASKGVTQAELYLGLECLEGSRWQEAYVIFNSLAERNDVDGKYYLGLCYENGWGVQKDEKAAVELYSQNSDFGHDKSIISLSRCYEEGRGGCATNVEFALELCKTLRHQGSEEAKNIISRLQKKIESAKILRKLDAGIPAVDAKKKNIHSSSSVPELGAVKSIKPAVHFSSIISSYLDLVQGFFSSKNVMQENKVAFFVGDHDSSLDMSIPLLQLVPERAFVVPTKS